MPRRRAAKSPPPTGYAYVCSVKGRNYAVESFKRRGEVPPGDCLYGCIGCGVYLGFIDSATAGACDTGGGPGRTLRLIHELGPACDIVARDVARVQAGAGNLRLTVRPVDDFPDYLASASASGVTVWGWEKGETHAATHPAPFPCTCS